MSKAVTSIYKHIRLDRVNFKFIIYTAFGYAMGLGVLFTFINPFAVAFLSLFLGTSNINFIIIYLSVLIGLYSSFSGLFFYTYLTACTVLLIINVIINKRRINNTSLSVRHKGLCSALAILIAGILPVFYYGYSFYFLFCFLFFAGYSLVLPIILSRGFEIFSFNGSIKPLSTEELISITVIFGGFILGMSNIHVEYFNFTTFLISTIILIVGYTSGSSNAVTSAVVLCFVLFLSKKVDSYELITFALYGMLSGLFKNGNKSKNIVGGIFALLIAYFYFNKPFFVMPNILALSMGILLFYVLPNNWYLVLQSTFGHVTDNSDNYGEKVKYFTSSKLNNYSKSFQNLSITFSGLAKKEDKLGKEEIERLINKVINKSCTDCKNKKYCWETVFYTSYNLVEKLINDIENGLDEDVEKSIESFSHVCINKNVFVDNVYIYFEFYISNMVWQNKIKENKSLIAEQLFDISNIFQNLVSELNNKMDFLPKYEKIVYKSLESNNILTRNVLIMKNSNGIYNAWVSLDISPSEKNTFRLVQKCVSKALNKNVKIVSTTLQHNGAYEIYLEEAYKYKVVVGVSKSKKANSYVSGDSYSTMNLLNGSTMLAVSDGMGSGKKASLDSGAAIELFEEFIETGFDKKIAIKLINSSLILKSSEDSFTTLDACIIDLYKGVGSFVKIGAAPSYLIRGSVVTTINSSSLPIGILSNIDTSIVEKNFQDNDIIVLVTDGVLEVIRSYDEQEKWIKNVLSSYTSKNPQDIADNLLLKASVAGKGMDADDMTIVVGKIVKSS